MERGSSDSPHDKIIGTHAFGELGKIIARAWTDEEYKKRFLSDPKSVLEESGIDLPDDREIRVVEDAPGVRHIVLPLAPAESELSGELSEDVLEQVAAGHGLYLKQPWA